MQPLDHQQAALAEILARGRAFYAGHWRGLAIQPRFHSLLVASTGTGKTAIAEMAAAELGATMLRVSAPSWMPSGAKSTVTETIAVIAAAVAANDRTLLCLDEADKLMIRTGDNSWKSYVLAEIFELADSSWPTGLKLPEDENDDPLMPIEALTTKLKTTVFILAIGTFQDWFDSTGSRRSMGFGAEIDNSAEEITVEEIAERLPRELTNRFNSSLIRMPELTREHYHRIAKQAQDTLPERMRQAFSEAVAARIAGAISAKKGVRFLEEALMETLKNCPPEELEKTNPIPSPETKTIDPFEICTL